MVFLFLQPFPFNYKQNLKDTIVTDRLHIRYKISKFRKVGKRRKNLYLLLHIQKPKAKRSLQKKDGKCYIILNTALVADPVKHICTLAEEVGHHFTEAKGNILLKGSYINELVNHLSISIDELNARVWAVNYLVPDTEFKQLIPKQQYTDKELASHFRVLEKFIKIKRWLLDL